MLRSKSGASHIHIRFEWTRAIEGGCPQYPNPKPATRNYHRSMECDSQIQALPPMVRIDTLMTFCREKTTYASTSIVSKTDVTCIGCIVSRVMMMRSQIQQTGLQLLLPRIRIATSPTSNLNFWKIQTVHFHTQWVGGFPTAVTNI